MPTRPDTLRRLFGLLLFTSAVACVALTAVFVQLGSIQATQAQITQAQAESRIRGLKLRAVGCRTIEAVGGSFRPGDPCLDGEVRPYSTPGR